MTTSDLVPSVQGEARSGAEAGATQRLLPAKHGLATVAAVVDQLDVASPTRVVDAFRSILVERGHAPPILATSMA
jgi:hypothetical protein